MTVAEEQTFPADQLTTEAGQQVVTPQEPSPSSDIPTQISSHKTANLGTPRIGRLAAILQSTSKSEAKTESRLPATAENILKVWRKYLEEESEKESAAFFINFIKTLEPKWKDGHTLYFESDNSLALSSLEKCRLDIIQFIKERVEIEKIGIETKLIHTPSDNQPSRPALTLDEQLMEVRKSNPAVDALIQKLSLEL